MSGTTAVLEVRGWGVAEELQFGGFQKKETFGSILLVSSHITKVYARSPITASSIWEGSSGFSHYKGKARNREDRMYGRLYNCYKAYPSELSGHVPLY